MTTEKKVARRKLTLLELAGQLGNVSRPAASSATAANSSARSAVTSRPRAPTVCSTGSAARATHPPNRVGEDVEKAILTCLDSSDHG